jgi:hypothetical protein
VYNATIVVSCQNQTKCIVSNATLSKQISRVQGALIAQLSNRTSKAWGSAPLVVKSITVSVDGKVYIELSVVDGDPLGVIGAAFSQLLELTDDTGSVFTKSSSSTVLLPPAPPPPPAESGLSAGVIAAIAVVSVLVVFGIVFGVIAHSRRGFKARNEGVVLQSLSTNTARPHAHRPDANRGVC